MWDKVFNDWFEEDFLMFSFFYAYFGRVSREGRYERDRSNTSRGEEGDGDSMSGRRGTGSVGAKYPDSHQLFVGNLPHNISERELKVFFDSKYHH